MPMGRRMLLVAARIAAASFAVKQRYSEKPGPKGPPK